MYFENKEILKFQTPNYIYLKLKKYGKLKELSLFFLNKRML